jgi:hypothetical protein
MKTKKNIVLLALSLCMLLPAKIFAWGAQGHRLVVETAFSILSPQAKARILALFGTYSPDLAATWMDSVRINHVPKYQYMSSWHFLNMEANQSYSQVASQGDVVYNLQRMVNFFNNLPPNISPDSLRTNLKILFHLMGDITQPLHCGYGSDLGANDDPVTTPRFNVSGNNLHHVWDDIIIQEGRINLQTCENYYHQLSPAQIQRILQGNTIYWMQQARSYLPQVYACRPTPRVNTNLTLSYLDSNVPVVQQQLVLAAVRLASVLNKAFGS